MTDREDQNRKPPPTGVTFCRDRAARDKTFLDSMRKLVAAFEREGRMTPEWRLFFDRVFASEGMPETGWDDFFAALAADDAKHPEKARSAEEVEAWIASMDYDEKNKS